MKYLSECSYFGLKGTLSVLWFFMSFLSGHLLYGQDIFFSGGINRDNSPKKTALKWEIDPVFGSYLYICFHNNEKKAFPPKMYFYIDRKIGDDFIEHATERVSLRKGGNEWVSKKVSFKEPGTYKVTALNAEKEPLAKALIYIDYRHKVFFSQKLDRKNRPLNHTDFFRQKQRGGTEKIYFFIKDTGAFNVNRLRISIVRAEEDESYIFADDTFPVEAHTNYAFLSYEVSKPGFYKVKVQKQGGEILGVSHFRLAAPA